MLRNLRARLTLPLLGAVIVAACNPRDDAPREPVAAMPLPMPVATAPVSPLPDTARDLDAGRVQLGKRLFEDRRLSTNGEIACASCHDVASGGDDGRRYSPSADGSRTRYNTPTVLNSSLNFAQFWDGRARTLEEQIRMTLASDEMGAPPERAVTALQSDRGIVAAFDAAYDEGLTPASLVDAIATYLRALTTPGSPFDRYLKGERSAIDAQARRGYELFTDLGCVSCHQGRNLGGNLFQHFGVMNDYFADRDVTRADYGRYNVTGREQDRFKFKVPTLRNVAQTPPYFHDGSAATLDEAVRVMIEHQLGRAIEDDKVAAIVAFLETLSAPVEASLR